MSAWKRHLALAGGAGVEVAHRELVLAFTAVEPERVYGAVLEMDVDAVFERISCPTLIMGGELDSIRGGFERAHALISQSEMEIVPKAGIYIVDEMPDLVADRLRGWFTADK
jgi:pimeloyl-ACP methyl ester carboxylesterase